MCVINHKHEYIFLHEPHTGGRSLEAALMEHDGSSNFNGEHHIPVQDMLDKDFVTAPQFLRYTKFRVIRNPFELLVTYWPKKKMTLNEFVFDRGLCLQKNGTLFWRYQYQTNNNLRFEWLQENPQEFAKLIIQIINKRSPAGGVKSLKIPHIGKTKNKSNWKDILTVSETKTLEKLYPDINHYGYGIFKDQDAGRTFA